MDTQLKITNQWNEEEALYVRKKLVEFNRNNLSKNDITFNDENFSLILKDKEECIFGGITGHLHFQCLHIEILWVDDKLRGQGYGAELLKMAENLAKNKKCRLIKLDTFSFQAPDFYKKMGYEIYGKIENYPEGFNQFFLLKRL